MKMKNLPFSGVAEKRPEQLEKHGDLRTDDYYWLRERENEEVLDYLRRENAHTEEVMADLKDFRQSLFEEMKGRIKETDMSVPYQSDGWWYYSRYEEGLEYPIYCRKEGSLDAPEEILLNVNELAKDYEYYQVVGLALSPNKKILAFGEDTLSRRIYTIRFKNLETGELLDERIENTSGDVAWANDNGHIFYSRKDETLRPYQVWRHAFESNPAEDVKVFEEEDATFNCFVYKSKSKKYILIGTSSTLSTEYRYLDADHPFQDFTIIQPREDDLEYGVGHIGDKFYVLTNWKAKNFRLMEVPVGVTSKEEWVEVIPHREDVLLEDIELFENYLILEERIQGIVNIRVMTLDGSRDEYLQFGEEAYQAYCVNNYEFAAQKLRISYTSMTTPSSIMEYDFESRNMEVLKQQEVLGEFDVANYQSERLQLEVRDGVKVPVSLVYRKGAMDQGAAPLLLYGYGSYGHSIDPYFSSVRLSLLDRGVVFAIAHIRGSETLGRSWYEDGKLLKKKNTFFDFIDVAESLIQKGYTSKEQLFAMGGSAGGLLMGAVMNERPDLFKGMVAAVPFVDVVTTMLDESIPLTTGEYDEWGNPNDPEYYNYIKSYSPYDQVEAKDYPNILVTTGLHDSQVQYWEPAKWVAKLRELKTDNNILLLQTEMDFGHSGASGRFESLKEIAQEYAFLLDLMDRAE
ncbi:S9 family peptidase [bacterium SCSIO 12741]|nr:S9 family peptidase [bacterium SCSIO 12741]